MYKINGDVIYETLEDIINVGVDRACDIGDGNYYIIPKNDNKYANCICKVNKDTLAVENMELIDFMVNIQPKDLYYCDESSGDYIVADKYYVSDDELKALL